MAIFYTLFQTSQRNVLCTVLYYTVLYCTVLYSTVHNPQLQNFSHINIQTEWICESNLLYASAAVSSHIVYCTCGVNVRSWTERPVDIQFVFIFNEQSFDMTRHVRSWPADTARSERNVLYPVSAVPRATKYSTTNQCAVQHCNNDCGYV